MCIGSTAAAGSAGLSYALPSPCCVTTPEATSRGASLFSSTHPKTRQRSLRHGARHSLRRTPQLHRQQPAPKPVCTALPGYEGAPVESAVAWGLLQEVWQSLSEAASCTESPDDAAPLFEQSCRSGWQTLAVLYLLQCGVTAGSMPVRQMQQQGASSRQQSPSQTGRSPLPASLQQQAAAAAHTSLAANAFAASGSANSSRGDAVRPPGATAGMAAQRLGPGGGGGGGGGPKAAKARTPDIGTLWGLLILGVAYVHHSTTGFALPALLPLINDDLHLSDAQGALLTSGYTVLYAAALVPVGLLADKSERPRLLAIGISAWSLLTMAASQVNSFAALLALRIGFAGAQAVQNPVCFGLIPELFPKQRTTAMAAYNSAIYMGRALSFGAVILAGQLGIPTGDIGITMVPLEAVDPSRQSLLYMQGEMAAVTPIYDYDFSILYGTAAQSSWREILWWIGPPGIVIAALALLTLDEPRSPPGRGFTGPPAASSRFLPSGGKKSKGTSVTANEHRRSTRQHTAAGAAAVANTSGDGAGAAALEAPQRLTADEETTWQLVRKLVTNPGFQAVTLASAMNDVGSWALVAWQATFYQRVFEIGSDVYAPLLAAIIPVGGIIGGVGGGLAGDWLSRRGGRAWLTVGASIVAGPVLAVSMLAPDYQQSFAALLVGFALSECWRAPSAIMVRDVSPQQLGSTASAIHLCVRNFLGGLGPLGVAYLSQKVGLQRAMLLVPTCFMLSGASFWFAEKLVAAEVAKGKAE